jgi:tRNA(Ile)-lysidine synthetase-like protein
VPKYFGVSGGADSLALAVLLTKYGRRIIDPKKVIWLHVNHGWRGVESDEDAKAVKVIGQKLGAQVIVKTVSSRTLQQFKKDSPENEARQRRKKIFNDCLKKYPGSLLLTAHHQDDLFETLLWRIMTGAMENNSHGIFYKYNNEYRPLLKITKVQLEDFLREENINWCIDRTNFEGKLLRSKMRLELIPALVKIFPKAKDHVIKLAQDYQKTELQSRESCESHDNIELVSLNSAERSEYLFAKIFRPLRVSRVQLEKIKKILGESNPTFRGEIQLKDGWSLVRK